MTTHKTMIAPKETEEASLALLSLAHIAETHTLHAEAKVLATLHAGMANARACPLNEAHKASPSKAVTGQPSPSASAAAVRDFWKLCEGQYKLVSAHGTVHPAACAAPLAMPASPQPVAAPRAPAAGAKRKAGEPSTAASSAAASGAKRCKWKGTKVLQQQGMTLAADGSARFSGPAAPLPPAKAPTTPPAKAPTTPPPVMRCRWKGPQLLPQGPPSRPAASGAESPRSVVWAL